MCASRGGAARSRFTRGLGGGAASSGRPRRRGCGTGTPSVRPETGPPAGCSQSPLGEPVAGGEGPGLRGLRAPLGLPRAARAPGAPSLPRTQPLRLPGPSCCCATHIWAEMARVGCGDHPAVWPEVPHLRLRLEKDSGRALGRPGRAAGPVPIPGGHEGAASPQEPGWGKDGEEGAAGAGGEAQRRPRAGVPSRRALRGPGPHTRIRPLAVGGEPRESGGHWGHSPGSARCLSREATNVLFDHLPS